jgi:hypothetical protein
MSCLKLTRQKISPGSVGKNYTRQQTLSIGQHTAAACSATSAAASLSQSLACVHCLAHTICGTTILCTTILGTTVPYHHQIPSWLVPWWHAQHHTRSLYHTRTRAAVCCIVCGRYTQIRPPCTGGSYHAAAVLFGHAASQHRGYCLS